MKQRIIRMSDRNLLKMKQGRYLWADTVTSCVKHVVVNIPGKRDTAGEDLRWERTANSRH